MINALVFVFSTNYQDRNLMGFLLEPKLQSCIASLAVTIISFTKVSRYSSDWTVILTTVSAVVTSFITNSNFP